MDATSALLLELIILILLLGAQLARAATDEDNQLDCSQQRPIKNLTSYCRPLKVYNSLQISAISTDERLKLARVCGCQLNALPWDDFYQVDEAMDEVYQTIKRLLSSEKYGKQNKYPEYMWSDVDVLVKGISIRVAAKDYFLRRDFRLLPRTQMLNQYGKGTLWWKILQICRRISRDDQWLYGYMENLQRISPMVFYELLELNPIMNITYQASKICKLLVIESLDSFKLKPDNLDLVKANPYELLTPNEEMDNLNTIDDGDVDTALRHASVEFKQCEHWQRVKQTLAQLRSSCSMMTGDESPFDWLRKNAEMSDSEKTRIALRCGCQLLLHNSSMTMLMANKDVDTMSKALTSYMNQIKFPDVKKVPLWALHGWFENTLKRFEENRKLTIKEIIKYKHGSQDPVQAINGKTMDEYEALELIRRACNLIVLNQGPKGSKQITEIKLIQHLDNLQYISKDPQFVFHLTLQDGNLFKLYALSKMCKPVLR